MALVPTKQVNGRLWSPGQSGNPNGRPVGSRTAFSHGFHRDLAEVWAKHGKETMIKTATDQPGVFFPTLRTCLCLVKGTAVYLAARHDTVPYALADNLRHNKANALGKASVSSSFTTLSPGGFLPPIPTIGAAQPSILSASMCSRPLPSSGL